MADTVGTVVEEEDGISILDPGLLVADNDGLEELIVLPLLVALLDGLDRVAALLSLAEDQALQRQLVPLPSLITVHGIVATNHRCDLTNADLLELSEKLLHITSTGLGVGVPTIAEEMNVDFGDAGSLGGLEKSVEVLLLGMHTTVRNQAAEVKSAVGVLGCLKGLLDHIVAGKLALLDGLIDANNILPDDTASANVQVADL